MEEDHEPATEQRGDDEQEREDLERGEQEQRPEDLKPKDEGRDVTGGFNREWSDARLKRALRGI